MIPFVESRCLSSSDHSDRIQHGWNDEICFHVTSEAVVFQLYRRYMQQFIDQNPLNRYLHKKTNKTEHSSHYYTLLHYTGLWLSWKTWTVLYSSMTDKNNVSNVYTHSICPSVTLFCRWHLVISHQLNTRNNKEHTLYYQWVRGLQVRGWARSYFHRLHLVFTCFTSF